MYITKKAFLPGLEELNISRIRGTLLLRALVPTATLIVLSACIRVSPLKQPKEPDLSRPAEAPATPGDIIPEWWATSSRNGGRNYLGIGGRHHSGIMGDLLRNRHAHLCASGE